MRQRERRRIRDLWVSSGESHKRVDRRNDKGIEVRPWQLIRYAVCRSTSELRQAVAYSRATTITSAPPVARRNSRQIPPRTSASVLKRKPNRPTTCFPALKQREN